MFSAEAIKPGKFNEILTKGNPMNHEHKRFFNFHLHDFESYFLLFTNCGKYKTFKFNVLIEFSKGNRHQLANTLMNILIRLTIND